MSQVHKANPGFFALPKITPAPKLTVYFDIKT